MPSRLISLVLCCGAVVEGFGHLRALTLGGAPIRGDRGSRVGSDRTGAGRSAAMKFRGSVYSKAAKSQQKKQLAPLPDALERPPSRASPHFDFKMRRARALYLVFTGIQERRFARTRLAYEAQA